MAWAWELGAPSRLFRAGPPGKAAKAWDEGLSQFPVAATAAAVAAEETEAGSSSLHFSGSSWGGGGIGAEPGGDRAGVPKTCPAF